MTTDILPTGRLLVTPIFLWGGCSLSLLEGTSRVALALHYARCGTPLGVIFSTYILSYSQALPSVPFAALFCFSDFWVLSVLSDPFPSLMRRAYFRALLTSHLKICPKICPKIHLSQRSLHNEPIFRLLLKVAVKGTQQCEFLNFCGVYSPI